jgi:thiamine biosynthesis lipoprotein
VSPLLTDLVATALRAADETGGDVDPTVGAALCGLGYDRDFARVTGRARVVVQPSPGDWRDVRLSAGQLTVPAGTLLDLGATAKARAADRCATLVAAACGVGVLVALGGDIATAGPAPTGGWRVRVQDGPDEPRSNLALPAGAAVATSSTLRRRWHSAGELAHHILDPRTGRPAPRVWRTTSVVARSCVRANTLATAAVVRGVAAPAWLRRTGAPARLVAADGTLVTTGGWPA